MSLWHCEPFGSGRVWQSTFGDEVMFDVQARAPLPWAHTVLSAQSIKNHHRPRKEVLWSVRRLAGFPRAVAVAVTIAGEHQRELSFHWRSG